MDSPDQASNDQSVLGGTPNEVGAPPKKGIPTRGPSNVNKIGEGSPLGVAVAPIPLPKPADTVFSRRRPPDQVLLSTYVSSRERILRLAGMVSPILEGAREIIQRWSSSNYF